MGLYADQFYAYFDYDLLLSVLKKRLDLTCAIQKRLPLDVFKNENAILKILACYVLKIMEWLFVNLLTLINSSVYIL